MAQRRLQDFPTGQFAAPDGEQSFVAARSRQLPQSGVEVAHRYSPLPVEIATAVFVKPGLGAGQSPGLVASFGKGQMLKSMQGVVMDEITQGRLCRQDVFEVAQTAPDPCPGVGRRHVCAGRFRRYGRGIHQLPTQPPNCCAKRATDEDIKPSSGAG
jgi:hypothetical protein